MREHIRSSVGVAEFAIVVYRMIVATRRLEGEKA